LAGFGGLFTFTNLASALAWLPTGAPNRPWRAIACSADGTKLVATGSGGDCGWGVPVSLPIYTSPDSGMTWMRTSAPINFWTCVASSADGVRLAAEEATH